MSFPDLPPQPPINLRADAYAETAVRLSRAAAAATRTVRDVRYGGDDPHNALDLYLPADEGLSGLPVLVNIHGGGWSHGYKEWMGLGAPAVVAFPAIFVSLGYRLAPARYPACLEDCLTALAWLVENVARYGGDPRRIFVGGHSAGGHLAAMMVLRRDLHARFGLPADPIRACFPVSGLYDMEHADETGRRQVYGMARTLIGEGGDPAAASPLTYVEGNATPFFVTWSENDNPFCKAQGPVFLEALKAQPGRAEGYQFPLFDHFWIHVDQQRPENPWTRTVRAWMTGDPRTAPVLTP